MKSINGLLYCLVKQVNLNFKLKKNWVHWYYLRARLGRSGAIDHQVPEIQGKQICYTLIMLND